MNWLYSFLSRLGLMRKDILDNDVFDFKEYTQTELRRNTPSRVAPLMMDDMRNALNEQPSEYRYVKWT